MQKSLSHLIKESESNYLDFKQEYYKNTADLIHDILCMANSLHDGDKYIIIGVTDKKEVCGIIDNVKQLDIVDLLRSAHISRSLHNNIRLENIPYDQKNCIVIIIQSRLDKPFFLQKDYLYQGKRLRAGVIYTRNADGNTPIDGTVTDDEMELMWRQRFALDKPPLTRFLMYLEDLDHWKENDHEGLIEEYYYNPFPEFRVISGNRDEITVKVPVNDKWIPKLWDLLGGDIIRQEYKLTYHGLSLVNVTVWWGDNGKEPIPLPNLHYNNEEFSWSLDRNSLQYKVGALIAKLNHYNLEDSLSKTKIIIK